MTERVTQRIDYNNISNTIVSALQTANTTTASYDLSMDLSKRVQQINRDDLFVQPQFKVKYPLISVILDHKREDIIDYNVNRRGRNVELVYSIVCVMEKFKDSEIELWDLVRNIDAVLRANVALNSYNTDLEVLALWSTGCSFSIEFLNANIGNFLFKALVTNESAFTKAAQINLTLRCKLSDERQLNWDTDTFNNHYYGDN